MFLSILFLIIGFALLLYGGHILVDGAVALSKRFHIPEIVIGLTVVACGTSAPEVAVSLSSVIAGNAGVGVGNILGSNIANIFFIIGICAVIYNLHVKKNTILYEMPFLCLVSLLLMLIIWQCNEITRWIAIIFCAVFALFLVYLFFVDKDGRFETKENNNMSVFKTTCFILIGIAGLFGGAKLTVNSATNIATMLNVSERIIGLTIIAFGTSLPELVTCVMAVMKKRSDIVIGNVIGSNLFNILFVLGITGLFQSVPMEPEFLIDAAFGVIATVILWLFVVRDAVLTRGNGLVLLALYGFYIFYLIK